MSKLAKNTVNKNSIVSNVFLNKILEFFLYYPIFYFRTIFLLISLLNYCSIGKKGRKKDLIWPISFGSFKIIFILLIKTIEI